LQTQQSPEYYYCIAWAQVRDDNNKEVDWLICGYENGSKYDIGLIKKGNGGLEACAKELIDGDPIFGACRLNKKGRFVTFYYCGEGTSVMKKGRAGMHKNGTSGWQQEAKLVGVGLLLNKVHAS
jgi:hypothetical protein